MDSGNINVNLSHVTQTIEWRDVMVARTLAEVQVSEFMMIFVRVAHLNNYGITRILRSCTQSKILRSQENAQLFKTIASYR